MRLNAERVDAIFRDCLFKDNEIIDEKTITDPVVVTGIVNRFGFHPERIEKHKMEIGRLLNELPSEFHKDKGGGWSFLNACNDKDGHQWTGLHKHMEQLFCLGIGTKQAEYLLPQDMWSSLPGCMPYIQVYPS